MSTNTDLRTVVDDTSEFASGGVITSVTSYAPLTEASVNVARPDVGTYVSPVAAAAPILIVRFAAVRLV